jgi:lipid II:glycine glycyltransferase (peptidoglycan interpeptide bridge formation enzyme)
MANIDEGMIYRKHRLDELALYESLAKHPMQSVAWGKFRETTGVKVERLIGFEEGKAEKQMQITFHALPKVPYTVGYYPKGVWPTEVELAALTDLGKQHRAIFIKLEPDVSSPPASETEIADLKQLLLDQGCVLGRPLFTPYSFILDLTQREEALLSKMKNKTRYNIRIAQKHEVRVEEDNSEEAFGLYLRLLELTTKRQKFYAHTKRYQENMWKMMSKPGIAKILKATYQNKILAVWILFHYKDTLYYPYGASSREHREVMASNLMLWEAMRKGKEWGCTRFDLWGSLGPSRTRRIPGLGFIILKPGMEGNWPSLWGAMIW